MRMKAEREDVPENSDRGLTMPHGSLTQWFYRAGWVEGPSPKLMVAVWGTPGLTNPPSGGDGMSDGEKQETGNDGV